MTLTVRDINPELDTTVRCLNCKTSMPIGDVQVTGDCMICPVCGEWERFEEVSE